MNDDNDNDACLCPCRTLTMLDGFTTPPGHCNEVPNLRFHPFPKAEQSFCWRPKPCPRVKDCMPVHKFRPERTAIGVQRMTSKQLPRIGFAPSRCKTFDKQSQIDTDTQCDTQCDSHLFEEHQPQRWLRIAASPAEVCLPAFWSLPPAALPDAYFTGD